MDYCDVFKGVFEDTDSLKSALKLKLHESAYESFLISLASIVTSKDAHSDKVKENYEKINLEFEAYIKNKPSKINAIKFGAKLINPNGIKVQIDEMMKSLDLKEGYQKYVSELIAAGFGSQLKRLMFDQSVFLKMDKLVVPANHEFYEAFRNYVQEYKEYLGAIKKFSAESKNNRYLRTGAGFLANAILPGAGFALKQFMSKEGDLDSFAKSHDKILEAYDNLTNILMDFVLVCLDNYRHILFVLYGGLLLECDKIQKANGREILKFDMTEKSEKRVIACFTNEERSRIQEWFRGQINKIHALTSQGYIKEARATAQKLFHKSMSVYNSGQMVIEQIGDIELCADNDNNDDEDVNINLQRLSYTACCLVENVRIKAHISNPLIYITETQKYINDMMMVPFDEISQDGDNKGRISTFELISHFIHLTLKTNKNDTFNIFINFADKFLYNAYTESMVKKEKLEVVSYNRTANILMFSSSHFGFLMKLAALYSGEKQGKNFKSKQYIEMVLECDFVVIKNVEHEYKSLVGKDDFYKFIKKYRKMLKKKLAIEKIKRKRPLFVVLLLLIVCLTVGWRYIKSTEESEALEAIEQAEKISETLEPSETLETLDISETTETTESSDIANAHGSIFESNSAILNMLNDNSVTLNKPESPFDNASLTLTSLNENTVFFEFSGTSGAHIGTMLGELIIDNNIGYYNDYEYDYKMKIAFYDDFAVIEAEGYNPDVADGVAVEGIYYIEPPEMVTDLETRGILTEEENIAFKELVGEEYSNFNEALQVLEYNPGVSYRKVVQGYTKGWASNAGIIIVEENEIWAAKVDDINGVVKYYTNSQDNDMPLEIYEWMEGTSFSDYSIVSQNNDNRDIQSRYMNEFELDLSEELSYIGLPERDLIEKLGVPDADYEENGLHYYQYYSYGVEFIIDELFINAMRTVQGYPSTYFSSIVNSNIIDIEDRWGQPYSTAVEEGYLSNYEYQFGRITCNIYYDSSTGTIHHVMLN